MPYLSYLTTWLAGEVGHWLSYSYILWYVELKISSTNWCHLVAFNVDVVFVHHFMAPHQMFVVLAMPVKKTICNERQFSWLFIQQLVHRQTMNSYGIDSLQTASKHMFSFSRYNSYRHHANNCNQYLWMFIIVHGSQFLSDPDIVIQLTFTVVMLIEWCNKVGIHISTYAYTSYVHTYAHFFMCTYIYL